VLIGLLLPAVQKVREAAGRVKCANNLRQMGIGFQQFYERKGQIPPAYTWVDQTPEAPIDPIKAKKIDMPGPKMYTTPIWPGWGWAAYILQDLDQGSLVQQIDFNAPTIGTQALGPRKTSLPIYNCPADTHVGVAMFYNQYSEPIGEAATTSYAGCCGTLGMMPFAPTDGNGTIVRNGKFRYGDLSDGTSNTILVAERATLFAQAPWVGPLDQGTIRTTPDAPVYQAIIHPPACMAMARFGTKPLNDAWSEPYDYFTPHKQYMNVLFADGSVRSASINTDPVVWQALATRAGGETETLSE
jgi:prepilin-type processing-associated H-X9-DG protein